MSLSRKKYHYMKITINGKSVLYNPDNYVIFPVMDVEFIIYDNNKNQVSSMKLTNLSHNTTHFFSDMDENGSIEINYPDQTITTILPSTFSFNLINFLKLYRPTPNGEYCCIHFAYEMKHGREKINNEICQQDFYELSQRSFSEEKLVSGDTIHLFNSFIYDIRDFRDEHHYAIYLGHQYYLSLAGTKGPLMITTLDAMKEAYQAQHCVQAIPDQQLSSKQNRYSFFKASMAIGLGIVGFTACNTVVGFAAGAIGLAASDFTEIIMKSCKRR